MSAPRLAAAAAVDEHRLNDAWPLYPSVPGKRRSRTAWDVGAQHCIAWRRWGQRVRRQTLIWWNGARRGASSTLLLLLLLLLAATGWLGLYGVIRAPPYRSASLSVAPAPPANSVPLATRHPRLVPPPPLHPGSPEHEESDPAYRREAVRRAFAHAWHGYKSFAWGHDELRPLNRTHNDWMNGIALTMIDALDTLYLMGMMDEFAAARDYLASGQHSFAKPQGKEVSVFEVNIRAMGGLMSAYHLSGDRVFLHKAEELGHLLYGAFHQRQPPAMPHRFCWFIRPPHLPRGALSQCQSGKVAFLSECGSLQLELRALAAATDDPLLQQLGVRADQVLRGIANQAPSDGMPSNLLMVDDGSSTVDGEKSGGRVINWGGTGDSYYEYVIKSYVQSRRTSSFWKYHTERVMDGLQYTVLRQGVLVPQEVPRRRRSRDRPHLLDDDEEDRTPANVSWPVRFSADTEIDSVEHLACFLPSLLVLAAPHQGGTLHRTHPRTQRYLQLGDELARLCYEMYRLNGGLAGENVIVVVDRNRTIQSPYADRPVVFIARDVSTYAQRPELLEALFYLWRATHNPKYREWGWRIFRAMESLTRVDTGGYVSCEDPEYGCRQPVDQMQSFFLAETLKYAYLLFTDDDVVDVLGSDWVLNTEGHPLRVSPS
ncbi:hypothetical protein CDCA_CDCA02G0793 [Cyanidium caldarium]|uniref:alpha-1,2-Mannosidase n=1 Tax=Cyanidium caldarium TaxID=2771 RepID=A0AAV9IS93_CYACA|nr:hypothetical protein CDCA_CDCA02G0793 [Cyanidium caldarium]